MGTGYLAKVFGIFQIRTNAPNEARYYSKYLLANKEEKKQLDIVVILAPETGVFCYRVQERPLLPVRRPPKSSGVDLWLNEL